MADLPGLIEGAHANIGMGHAFLKHVERTSLLLMIIDIFGFQLSPSHTKRNCIENIFALNKELELYDKTLLDKPCVLLINKMDMNGSNEEYLRYQKCFENLSEGLEHCPDELKPTTLLKFEQIIPISAKNNQEIDKVKVALRRILDLEVKQQQFEETINENPNEKILQKLRERGPKVF